MTYDYQSKEKVGGITCIIQKKIITTVYTQYVYYYKLTPYNVLNPSVKVSFP